MNNSDYLACYVRLRCHGFTRHEAVTELAHAEGLLAQRAGHPLTASEIVSSEKLAETFDSIFGPRWR